MEAKPASVLGICIVCMISPTYKGRGHGFECPGCKRSANSLEEWNELNRFTTSSDVTERLVHYDYGLQPYAIELLKLMRECAREPLRVIAASGMEQVSQDEVDLLICYVIGELATRPEPEVIRIGGRTINLV